MYSTSLQDIRELTLQATKLVELNEIEQCNIVLLKRQHLLEQLNKYYLSLSDNKEEFKQHFIELIYWIQQQDQPSCAQAIQKKQQNIKKSMLQVQTKKALKQYKNTE